MLQEIMKAINDVSNKANEMSQRIDECFNKKHTELEEELTDTQLALADSYEENLELQDELTNTQMALADQYEENLAMQEELTNTQLALTEIYETMNS